VGVEASKRLQYATGRMDGEGPQIQDGASRDSVRGQDSAESDFVRPLIGSNNRALSAALYKTKRRVWDILDAGPRNRFTCEGVLVHNCTSVMAIADCRPMRKSLATCIQMWGRGLRSHPGKSELVLLDFSGNRVRFAEDFENFFFNGLDKLDDGKKLEKKIRESEPKDAKSCPRCGATPFFRRCVACGYQKPLEERLIHRAGEMVEFKVGKHTVEKRDLWIHCLTYRLRHGKVETAEGSAAHLYKSIAGTWPPRDRPGIGLLPEIGAVNPAVLAKARQRLIAYNAQKAS